MSVVETQESLIWRVFHHRYLFQCIIQILRNERECYDLTPSSWNEFIMEDIIRKGDISILMERLKRGERIDSFYITTNAVRMFIRKVNDLETFKEFFQLTGLAFPLTIHDACSGPSLEIVQYIIEKNKRKRLEDQTKKNKNDNDKFSPFGTDIFKDPCLMYAIKSTNENMLDYVFGLVKEYAPPSAFPLDDPSSTLFSLPKTLETLTRDGNRHGRSIEEVEREIKRQERVLLWIERNFRLTVSKFKRNLESSRIFQLRCIYRTGNRYLIDKYTTLLIDRSDDNYHNFYNGLPTYLMEITQSYKSTQFRMEVELCFPKAKAIFDSYKAGLIQAFKSWTMMEVDQETINRITLNIIQLSKGTIPTLQRLDEIVEEIIRMGWKHGGKEGEKEAILYLISNNFYFVDKVNGSHYSYVQYYGSPKYSPFQSILRQCTLEQIQYAILLPQARPRKSVIEKQCNIMSVINRTSEDDIISIFKLLEVNDFFPDKSFAPECTIKYKYYTVHSEDLFIYLMENGWVNYWRLYIGGHGGEHHGMARLAKKPKLLKYLVEKGHITHPYGTLVQAISRDNNIKLLEWLFDQFPKQNRIRLLLHRPLSTRFIRVICSRFKEIIICGKGVEAIAKMGSVELLELISTTKGFAKVRKNILEESLFERNRLNLVRYLEKSYNAWDYLDPDERLKYMTPDTYLYLLEKHKPNKIDINSLLENGKIDIIETLLSKGLISLEELSKSGRKSLLLKEAPHHRPIIQQLKDVNIVVDTHRDGNLDVTHLFDFPSLI